MPAVTYLRVIARLVALTFANLAFHLFLVVSSAFLLAYRSLLASQSRCVFVAKAEVRDWPAIGRLCASADTLFIQRESKRDIPRIVSQIEGVMEGDSVLPFRPPLLESAARAGLPVSFGPHVLKLPAQRLRQEVERQVRPGVAG